MESSEVNEDDPTREAEEEDEEMIHMGEGDLQNILPQGDIGDEHSGENNEEGTIGEELEEEGDESDEMPPSDCDVSQSLLEVEGQGEDGDEISEALSEEETPPLSHFSKVQSEDILEPPEDSFLGPEDVRLPFEEEIIEMVEVSPVASEDVSVEYKDPVRVVYESKIFMDEFKSVANRTDTSDEQEHIVNVTFRMEDGRTFVRPFHMHTNMFEVKESVAKIFQNKSENVRLLQCGSEPDNWLPLAGLGAKSKGDLAMDVMFTVSDKSLEGGSVPKFEPLSTSMTVRVQDPDGSYRSLTVQVTNLCFYKLWCGGYRNKLTNKEYHNAETQTRPVDRGAFLPPGEEPALLFSRQTQTHRPYITTSTVTPAEKSTQMWRTDHYIPSLNDKILEPKKYTSYDELEAMKYTWEKIVMVQKTIRGWVARRKYLRELARIKEEARKAKEAEAEKLASRDKEARSVILNTIYPNSRKNFYKLYSKVNEWWIKQYHQIAATKEGPARKAALYLLLLKEIGVLFLVEKQRIKAKVEALRRKDLSYLEKTSCPKLVRYTKGIMTITDSLEIQRVREFKEIYSSYIRTDLSIEERIDVIVMLKDLLEGYEAYECLQELLQLLERELDFMALRVEEKYLSGLRKRIEDMMFDFLKQPEFNPQAGLNKKEKESNIKYLCHSCRKLCHRHHFLVHTRTTSLRTCHSCMWLARVSQCQNMAPYQDLLKKIRHSEVKRCCHGATCFFIQPLGLHYIVTVLWNGRSAINQSDNIDYLRLPRWHREEDWSPWNCILLTEEETALHEQISDVEAFYDYEFVQKVKTKHALTRYHFYELFQVDKRVRKSGLWDSVRDVAPYMNKSYLSELAQIGDPFFEKPPYKSFK